MLHENQEAVFQIVSGGVQHFLKGKRNLLLFLRVPGDKNRSSSGNPIAVVRNDSQDLAHGLAKPPFPFQS